jgi:hypothetical protein
MSQDSVRLAMAIILSVMIEIGSSLLLDVAAVGKRQTVTEGSRDNKNYRSNALEPADASVEGWAKSALLTKRNGSIRCTDARGAFERSIRAGGGVPPNANSFGRAMTALGYRRKKKSGHFHYVGVVLSTPGLRVIG